MRLRPSARLVLVDDRERVLLIRFVMVDEPGQPPGPRSFWATPGGGVEPGESFEAAAARELWEETGLRDVPLGGWVWVREQPMPFMGEWIVSHERYFLARVPATDVRFVELTAVERDACQELRWWSVDELRATAETVYPTNLADLLQPLLAGNVPAEPLTIFD